MSNHQNRGSKGPHSNPEPADIKEARETALLSQTAAASLIYAACRTWQQWEAGERRMHPAFWELFRIKLSEIDTKV